MTQPEERRKTAMALYIACLVLLFDIICFTQHHLFWTLVFFAMLASLAVEMGRHHQDGQFRKVDLKKLHVDFLNRVRNMRHLFAQVYDIIIEGRGQDTEIVRLIAAAGTEPSWAWFSNGSSPFPPLPPILDDGNVYSHMGGTLEAYFREVLALVDRYNQALTELRKKEKLVLWGFLYSSRGLSLIEFAAEFPWRNENPEGEVRNAG